MVCVLIKLLISHLCAVLNTSPEWKPLRGIFPRKKCFGKGRPVSNGLFPSTGYPAYWVGIMGAGVPASSQEVIPSQPWQLVPSPPWTTIRERNLRGNRERLLLETCTLQSHVPEVAHGLVPGAVLLLHPLLGPSFICLHSELQPS